MKATLYKSLSNKKNEIELQAGKTLAESLPEYNLENSVIVANNKLRKPDYKPVEGDTITIRLLPGATVTAIVIGVVAAVVAVTAGIIGGIAMYKAKQAAEEAEAEMDKAKRMSNRPDIDNRPFLRGASNTLATGNSQPYIIGRHFFTPYLLSKPFYKIVGTDGAEQYTYTALECGFNKQIIKKLSIDDITIKTFSDTEPQEGAYSLDQSVFAEDGACEIAQDGGLLEHIPELNYKTESKACNDEVPRDSEVQGGTKAYLTYSLDQYAKDVDIAISFPYGLYAMNTETGYPMATQVTITPQYSLDGGSSWTDFAFNQNGTPSNVFFRNEQTKELRFVAHKDFTKADYDYMAARGQKQILIRLRNNGGHDSTVKNDCYCLFYQSVCFDPNKSASALVPCLNIEDRERAYSAVLGLRLKATKNNEEKLKKINIVTQGVARVWNGTEWSATKTATRNPAAWALEIETSPSHPASRRDDSELDLESFGEFYEWCEANGYYFDWVITQNAKKDDTLNKIMEATGACIYTDIYGRRAVAIDRPQENALAVYNPQNIISIQNKKTFGRRTDALRVKYVNGKDDLYQEDTYIVMREVNGVPLTLNENSVIKDITATGITTFEHIVKYARRLMAVEALRPKTTTIEVGNEGIFYTPLSKILIQDDSLKIGIGKGFIIRDCEWHSGLLKKIYTNEPLTFDPMKTYGIIANCYTEDGAKTVAIKVEGEGTTDELTVLTQIRASADAKPEAGNIFSFGELDIDGEFSRVTTPYLISAINRSEKGFRLELVNYNEAIYDSGTIPDYKSNITPKAGDSGKDIPADTVTKAELMEAVAAIDPDGSGAAQEAANEVVHGIHFTNVHKIRDMELSLEEVIAKMDDDQQRMSASISISEEEILLRVDDMERELVGLIDVQAGAVTALVEGGGAEGHMALSLELPAVIDAATRVKMVRASTEAKVAAVYAKLDGSDLYGIKGNAATAAVKALWNDAVAGALIASQIDLTATQIQMAAERVVITGQGATHGQTIIEGGKIRASLIEAAALDAQAILAQNITLKPTGYLQSADYSEVNSFPNSGFKIDAANSVIKAFAMKAKGGSFYDMEIAGNSIFRGSIESGPLVLKNEETPSTVHSVAAGTTFWGDEPPSNMPPNSFAGLNSYNWQRIYGTYGNVTFYYYAMWTDGYGNRQMRFYDDYKNIVFAQNPDGGQSSFRAKYTLVGNLTWYYLPTGAKTFRLLNLPTTEPSVAGTVWIDGNTLKIKT